MSIFLKIISFSSALLLAGTYNQIYSQEHIEIDIKSNTLISNALEEKEIKTVTASGFGTTLESAFQNAAENALTIVVGSFIDAETQIKKQKEIRDGVISKTKIIKKDVRDYSQGSIKYFEVLNIEQKASIYIVTARVDVRIEDFRVYIKNLAYGSTKINQGIFSSIKTDEDNVENQLDLLGKITNPLLFAEVIDINIGTPQRLVDLSAFGCRYNREDEVIDICTGEARPIRVFPFPAKGSIVIPVTFELNKDFLDNAINILDNISSHKKIKFGKYEDIQDGPRFNFNKDFQLSLYSSKNKSYTQYVLSDAKSYHKKRVENKNKIIPIYIYKYRNQCDSLPSLRITLINKNKVPVWVKERSMCNLDRDFNISEPDIKIGMRSLYLPNTWEHIYPDLFWIDNYSKNLRIFDQARSLLIIDPSNKLIDSIEEVTLEFIQN